MFEIHGRHKPMFVMSDIQYCAKMFTNALQINQLDILKPGIEILNISQTVRLNENNEYIVKSALSYNEVQLALNEHPVIKKLALSDATSGYLEEMVSNMVAQLGIDSYFCIGEPPHLPIIEKMLQKATVHSQKPLVIFNTSEPSSFEPENRKWYDLDHPALWIGQKNWESTMDSVEAFFAMSPAFKFEVSLNRYQSLGRFQNFSMGLVKF